MLAKSKPQRGIHNWESRQRNVPALRHERRSIAKEERNVVAPSLPCCQEGGLSRLSQVVLQAWHSAYQGMALVTVPTVLQAWHSPCQGMALVTVPTVLQAWHSPCQGMTFVIVPTCTALTVWTWPAVGKKFSVHKATSHATNTIRGWIYMCTTTAQEQATVRAHYLKVTIFRGYLIQRF